MSRSLPDELIKKLFNTYDTSASISTASKMRIQAMSMKDTKVTAQSQGESGGGFMNNKSESKPGAEDNGKPGAEDPEPEAARTLLGNPSSGPARLWHDTVRYTIIFRFWIPLVPNITRWLVSLGAYPMVVARESLDVHHLLGFSDSGSAPTVTVKVPAIPDVENIVVRYEDRNDNGQSKFFFKLKHDEKRTVHIIRSNLYEGPRANGTVDSPVSILLDEYEDLLEHTAWTKSAVLNRAVPRIFVERVINPGDAANSLATSATSEMIIENNPTLRLVGDRLPEDVKIESVQPFKTIVDNVTDGMLMDPVAGVCTLPPNRKIGVQPRQAEASMLEHAQTRFDQRVSAIFQVPIFMLGYQRTGDRATHSMDMDRFSEGVKTLNTELIYAFEQMSSNIYDDTLVFNLPMKAALDIEQLHEAWLQGVITSRAYKRQWIKMTNMTEEDTVAGLVRMRGVKKPRTEHKSQ